MSHANLRGEVVGNNLVESTMHDDREAQLNIYSYFLSAQQRNCLGAHIEL